MCIQIYSMYKIVPSEHCICHSSRTRLQHTKAHSNVLLHAATHCTTLFTSGTPRVISQLTNSTLCGKSDCEITLGVPLVRWGMCPSCPVQKMRKSVGHYLSLRLNICTNTSSSYMCSSFFVYA